MYIFLLVQLNSSLCLLVQTQKEQVFVSSKKATQEDLVCRRICLAGIEWFCLNKTPSKKIQIPVIYI